MNAPLLLAIFLAGLWAIRDPRLLRWFALGVASIAIGELLPHTVAASMALTLVGAFTVLTASLLTVLDLQKEKRGG